MYIAPKSIVSINQFFAGDYVSKIYETYSRRHSESSDNSNRVMAFPYSYDETNFRLKLSIKMIF